MKLGPFFFDTKELFLVLLAGLIVLIIYLGWQVPFFDLNKLLLLVILFFLVKGLLSGIHNENFLILAIITIFLSLYLTAFQIVLFFFIALLLFRFLKVI